MDARNEIDISKISNALHFERIIDFISEDLLSLSLKDAFDAEGITKMITSRHPNWSRPRDTEPIDELKKRFIE